MAVKRRTSGGRDGRERWGLHLLLGLSLLILGSGCAAGLKHAPSRPAVSLNEVVDQAVREARLAPDTVASWRLEEHRATARTCLNCPVGWATGLIARLDADPLFAMLPFESTPEIKAFAERNTRRSLTEFQRASDLLAAIYAIGRFAERYDAQRTTTATETLMSMRGNCFSFTNLFVASARAVGLDAYFLDATRSDSSVRFDGQRVLYAGHIVAGVETNAGRIIVDFYQIKKANERFWYKRLIDQEVTALFINNLGYEAMRRDLDPVPFFRVATTLAPGLESPWNNLATVLRMQGDMSGAKLLLEQSVARRPDSFAPYYNLGLIYMQDGRFEEAEELFKLALLRKYDNSYLAYQMGVAYLRQGKQARARLAFRYAVSLDRSNSAAQTKLERLAARH